MCQFLFRFIFGYLKVCYKGKEKVRFLQLCKKNGVELWDLHKTDDTLTFKISRSDYIYAQNFLDKITGNLEILNKIGIPYLFYRYKKRKIFLLSFMLFLFVIKLFTFYIWKINVTGTKGYTKEEIVKNITENYIPIGTKISNIDCEDLEEKLRLSYPDVAWISCNIKGTELNVNLSETVPKNTQMDFTVPCNMIAAKDAVISEVMVKDGLSLIHIGDEVKKGDVLITGVINISNEYDEYIETDYVSAKGEVYGITKYDYMDSFPLEYYKKQYTGNKKKTYGFQIINKFINIPYTIKFNSAYDCISEEHNIRIGKTYSLPFGVTSFSYREYIPKREIYAEEEAKNIAEERLEIYLADLRKKGVEILENNVKIVMVDGICKASGTIVSKELIGVPSAITIFNQGEDLNGFHN